jgi:hypothetical protein
MKNQHLLLPLPVSEGQRVKIKPYQQASGAERVYQLTKKKTLYQEM